MCVCVYGVCVYFYKDLGQERYVQIGTQVCGIYFGHFLCFNYIFMLQIYFFKCISSYLSLNSCFILRPQMSAREFSQWLKLVDADILFIYISCNPLSWFSLLEAPIPSSLPVLLYRCSHTHRLLPPHPDIPLHWGIEPSQDQGPLLPLMPNKAILCYI